jgi:tetratricopeptide (TPR) repeat protein
VGAAAAGERAWPVVYEAYALLREEYPRSPFVDDSRMAFGEAQVETGRPADGRRTLEQSLAGVPADARTARARITLGRAREMTGDPAGALDAYTDAARALPAQQWAQETQLAYGRLLTGARRYDEARSLLAPVLKTAPPPVAAESALSLGEALQGQGDQPAAIEYFMTAAYLAPETAAGRRGLLAAGRAFAAMKEPEAATTVYRKLLAQTGVPADLADAARRALADLPK